MEQFLLNTPDFHRLYNCSFYDVSSVPLAQRQHVLLGVVFVVITVVQVVLYIPCLVVIWRLSKENACYKMMLAMGVSDWLAVSTTGVATCVLGITGAVYCSWPEPIYVLGCMATALWVLGSTLEVMLAANRCLAVLTPDHPLFDRLFGGWCVWAWIAVAVGYGLYVFVSQQPLLFSGLIFAWHINPHFGYVNSTTAADDYTLTLITVHNPVVVVALTSTYALLVSAVFWRVYVVQRDLGTMASSFAQHKMIFFQVVLISAVNGVTASIYVYMQYFPSTIQPWLVYVASFLGLQAQGLPPVIYLAMNRSIRTECYHLCVALVAPLFSAATAVKPPATNEPLPPNQGDHQKRQQQAMLNITRNH